MPKFDKLTWQRKHRSRTSNRDTKKYEKTINGFLVRAYRNMQSRVMGIQKSKAHLYKGLSIMPREEFYKFSKGDRAFMRLWRDWVACGYTRVLSPSVNRIDPRRGYEIGNVEWLTQSENSRLGGVSRGFGEIACIGRLANA
jgi:hypothetical protein